MCIRILKIQKEHCPSARLMGKRYESAPNWGEWWENSWFSQLETMPRLPFNGDAYLGAVRVVNGKPEYWIGMLFPADTEVPEGFEAVDVNAADYAVCYLYGQENSREFYTQHTRERCLQALKSNGFTPDGERWRFERYQCPRFTTPDEHGCVILDYGISIL